MKAPPKEPPTLAGTLTPRLQAIVFSALGAVGAALLTSVLWESGALVGGFVGSLVGDGVSAGLGALSLGRGPDEGAAQAAAPIDDQPTTTTHEIIRAAEGRGFRVRVETLTAISGLLLGGGALTASELIRGQALAENDRGTTLFGGEPSSGSANGSGATGVTGPTTCAATVAAPGGGHEHSFGQVALGSSSAPAVITVANPCEDELTVGSASTSDVAAFPLVDGCAGAPLAPDESCSIEVSFSPPVTGPVAGAVVLSDDGAGSSVEIAVAGEGVPQE